MTTQAQVDAIQPDVSDDDAPESAVALRSARDIAMEQIELANLRRMEEESGVKLIQEDADPAPVDDQLEDQIAAPAQTPATRVVKVDGEERTVTEDELIRSYQKNAAADRRLEEAARLLHEANERAAQLAAQIEQNTYPVEQPEAPADLRDQVKSALTAIYGGDEDQAAEALTNLLTKNRGGDQPTPQVVLPSVDQLAAEVEARLEINAAFAKFKADYPDLIADPDLEMLTANKINRLVATGTPRAVAMLEAGAEVYQMLGKNSSGRQAEPEAPRANTRQDNKAKLEPVRAASSAAALPETDLEGDPSSVIQEMAARRLGQSLPRRTG